MNGSKYIFNSLLAIVFISGLGCTDAERAKLSGFGSAHSVKCYSGGIVIYEGTASGKVQSEAKSDGYYFNDKETGKLMEVAGNCVITRLD